MANNNKHLPPNTLAITNASPSAVAAEMYITQKYPIQKLTIPIGATRYPTMPKDGLQQQSVNVILQSTGAGPDKTIDIDVVLDWTSGDSLQLLVLADRVLILPGYCATVFAKDVSAEHSAPVESVVNAVGVSTGPF